MTGTPIKNTPTTNSHKEDDTMTGITVWTKPDCTQCTGTFKFFETQGISKVALTVKDLTHPDNAAQLQNFKERGLMQAPIVQTPQETWSGFNPDKIKTAATQMRTSTPSPAMSMTGPGLH